MRDGVRVRVCKDSEKLAVAGNHAWLGSANATYADGKWAMPDWGLCTDDAEIAGAVRQRLEREWAAARDFKSAAQSAGRAVRGRVADPTRRTAGPSR